MDWIGTMSISPRRPASLDNIYFCLKEDEQKYPLKEMLTCIELPELTNNL